MYINFPNKLAKYIWRHCRIYRVGQNKQIHACQTFQIFIVISSSIILIILKLTN